MNELFGLSMNTIMIVLLVLLGITLSTVLLIFLRNRIIFLMGLRNIPRRMAQTVLIVIGLMLSTVIITAAFTTGDTVDYSITKQTYDLAGHTDIVLDGEVGGQDGSGGTGTDNLNIAGTEYRRFLAVAEEAQMPDVDGYTGLLAEPVPVVNNSTRLSEPNVNLVGVDREHMDAFPDIIDSDSGDVLSLDDLKTGEVFLNESAADELDANAGDELTVYIQSQPNHFTVRAIVEDTLVGGAIDFMAKEGMVIPWDEMTQLFHEDEVTVILVSATGGVRDSVDASKRAEMEINELIGRPPRGAADPSAYNNLRMEVSDTKAGLIDEAEEVGNFMTTFFLILGLFSIGAGMLLVVMIFVMLAAERKSEMGMARAVGTKRLHLIEMFLAEGTAYNMAAALVGVALGILVAFALTTAASAIFATFGFSFTPHVTLRTVVVSGSIGAILTFITVAFSSWRISNLNIVAAIRDINEAANKRMGWRGLVAWIVVLAFGAFMVWVGLGSDKAFPFALGVSLLLMGAAVLATHFGAPPRPAFTTMGLVLLLFWGLTAGNRLEGIFGKLDGDFEMFFLSGVSMVTASTFVLIYNSDVFLAVISRLGGRFGSILPALRTAVAYPMANRFRTGMTLAMISLVVFSLTTMSAMNLNYDKLFLEDESRGGWDVQVVENPNNPLTSVKEALERVDSPAATDIKAEGTLLLGGFGSSTEASDGLGWSDYRVSGMTDDFIDNGSVPLGKIANGYDDAGAVWEALKTEPDVALIDSFAIEGGFGPSEYHVDGIPTDEDTYDAPTISVRDATSGETREVRLIGVIAFGASSNFTGIYMGEEAFTEVFGDPELSIHYVALTNPDDSKDVAKEIEAALMTTGSQADSLQEIAEENNALSRNFLYLMQAFMGLGLVVGIAAIGVIAFRTVVERRQQIGMLRAIGYKKSMVQLSFILESSYVTVLGVLSGVILGLWLAYFLVTSDDFPGDGGTFYVPWLQLIVITVLTIVASVLMTLVPSRQAASVPTAEALRYE